MLTSIGLVVLGLVLLLVGGEMLLRGAVGLSTLLKLTPAVIGLTVVAAGTSVPELAVSGIAAYQGKTDIAVANVVGSNIFNIAVILGICALIRPMPISGNRIKLEYPVLVMVTLLCLVIAQDGEINWLDAIFCLAVYVGFTAYLVALVRQQVTASENKDLKAEVKNLTPEGEQPRAWLCIGLVGTGVLLLAGGAHATVVGASALARLLGLSDRVIGLTIVSAGTGLPEVVASLVSSIRGRSDVAIANVIGSNPVQYSGDSRSERHCCAVAGPTRPDRIGLLVDAWHHPAAVSGYVLRNAGEPLGRRIAADDLLRLHRIAVDAAVAPGPPEAEWAASKWISHEHRKGTASTSLRLVLASIQAESVSNAGLDARVGARDSCPFPDVRQHLDGHDL